MALLGRRSTRRTPGEKTQAGVLLWAAVLAVLMVACCVVFAVSAPKSSSRLGVGATSIALVLAASAVGAFLGFLFGLPRARVVEKEGAGTDRDGKHFVINSNLIKVSDWLTTILVGVGLVQLGRVPPAIGAFAELLEPRLGGSAYAGTFGVAMALTAAVAAAVLFYLFTCVRVRELFEAGEQEDTVQRLIDTTLEERVANYVADGGSDQDLEELRELRRAASDRACESLLAQLAERKRTSAVAAATDPATAKRLEEMITLLS